VSKAVIENASGEEILQIINGMHHYHMNERTRDMLKAWYPAVYEKLIRAQYTEAEKRLVTLLQTNGLSGF
jgi:hypothetical protein